MNKVETAVIAYFSVSNSQLLSDEQKAMVMERLSNRINAEGEIVVKSQEHRTQLANREEAIKKMNLLVTRALHKKKPRIATRPSKASVEKRKESKKKLSEKKAGRKRMDPRDF